MAEEFILSLITAGKPEEAEKIASALVEERLAACCNIIPAINSIYRWQGKICRDTEVLLIAKTRKSLFASLCKRVEELHSYELPEIISLPITAGHAPYLKWLSDETSAG